MTIKEALREAYENCTECKLVNDCVKEECRWHHIIKALEKQIPMKTIIVHETDFNVRHYLCPLCDEWVSEGANYCADCGQAIDWSDTE